MVIYKTINLINDKFYIGKDKNNNPNYLGSGILLKKAIKKYGRENFKKEIIEYCENIKQLSKREIYYIKKYKAIENGYNIAIGGEGGPHFKGHKHSKKTKELIKKKQSIMRADKDFVHNMTGYKFSKEAKEKMSKNRKGKYTGKNNSMFGRKHTEESRKKMSRPQFGEDNGMYGKHHTEETKKKLREANKGKKNAFYGKKHSKETKKIMSKKAKGRKAYNRKKVMVGKIIFDSATEAAMQLEICIATITYRCRNRILNYKFIS